MREGALDAGINEFIAKPASVKTMMQRLMSVIEHPWPFVRTKSYFWPMLPAAWRRRISPEGPSGAATKDGTPAEAAWNKGTKMANASIRSNCSCRPTC